MLLEIWRFLHLTKAILSPNGRYFPGLSALFLEKRADYPLYQTVESFRLAIASAYRLAQANMAYRRFSFFFKPLYTVFLYPNWHLMILNACSTLHRTVIGSSLMRFTECNLEIKRLLFSPVFSPSVRDKGN